MSADIVFLLFEVLKDLPAFNFQLSTFICSCTYHRSTSHTRRL